MQIARLEADHDAERSQVPRDDGSVGVEVDGAFGLAGDAPDAAADVDLLKRVAGLTIRPAGSTAAASAASNDDSPSASQPDPAWKWSVSTIRPWRRTAASASSSRSAVMPSLVGRSPA